MDNQILQALLELLKNTRDGSKDDDKTTSIYSQMEDMLSKYLQSHQEAYRGYGMNEHFYPPYRDGGFPHPDRKEGKSCILCETGDLVKNGGFEAVTRDMKRAFESWMQETDDAVIAVSNIPYEGELAARLISKESRKMGCKRARLFQNVNVTPGCRYKLSFAENFFIYSMKSGSRAKLSARVFYGDPTNHAKQVDLINLVIYKPCSVTASNKGYSWHSKAAEAPVPEDVSSLTVEFVFDIKDIGGTEWKIDGVSLHSIAAATAEDD